MAILTVLFFFGALMAAQTLVDWMQALPEKIADWMAVRKLRRGQRLQYGRR